MYIFALMLFISNSFLKNLEFTCLHVPTINSTNGFPFHYQAQWIIEDNRPEKDWPQAGEVIFDKYSTQYRKGLDLVLREISCNVKPGEKVLRLTLL